MPTEIPEQSVPPTGQELVEKGYHPITVTDEDIHDMLTQIQALQAQVAHMQMERGVPLDPVDGHRVHLKRQIDARKAMYPNVDFSDVDAAVSKFPENSDNIGSRHTRLTHHVITEWLKRFPGHELDYLGVLSGELHTHVMTRENRDETTRLDSLEKQIEDLRSQLLVATPVPTKTVKSK